MVDKAICAKVDECHKVVMVMDKDMPDELRAERIRAVCRKCPEWQATAEVLGEANEK